MSAFIVNHDHISALVTGFARHHYDRLSRDEATELGQLLLIENSRSVAYRYNEPVDEDWRDYRFEQIDVKQIVHLLKMLDCLEYQSNERPDYEESIAYKKLMQMRKTLIRALPGYEDGPWEYRATKTEAA